jgi:hypothetical protein
MRSRNGRGWRFAAAALALAGALWAQNQQAAPGLLEGTVVSTLTGEPVVRAHVRVHGDGQDSGTYGAMTNDSGKFSISPLPAGSYSVVVVRVGFSAPPEDDRTNEFTLAPGQRKDDLKLRLTPDGSITGTVVDSEGAPVQGAAVTAGSARANTDRQGRYRLGGLTPGRYRVKAQPVAASGPPEIRTDGTKEVHHAPTWFGGALKEPSGAWVAVGPGAETAGIEIRLIAVPITRISGRVTGFPAGKRPQLAFTQSMSTTTSSVVKADGSFEIWRTEPGKYTVTAELNDAGQRLSSAPVDLEVGTANVENVELAYVPDTELAGLVIYEDEKAKPRARPGQPASAASRAVLVFSNAQNRAAPGPAAVGEDARFVVKGLRPDRYRIRPGWGGVYVKSIRVGETGSQGAVVDLSRVAAGSAITVQLSSAVATITGTVEGAAEDCYVLLGPETPNGFPPTVTLTGGSNVFSFADLAPGRYRIVALTDQERQSAERDGLDQFGDRVETVDAGAGEKVTKNLKLQAQAR